MINIQKIIVPDNYLYYMKLGVNDLKMMITEFVQRILEYHGAIDGRTRFLNPSPEDFEKAKKAIVKKLKMAYNVFFKKVSKIFYDETTQYYLLSRSIH